MRRRAGLTGRIEPPRHRVAVTLGATSACIGLGVALVLGAQFEAQTRQAWEGYAEKARRSFLERVPADGPHWAGDAATEHARLRSGDIIAGAGGEDGIIEVPGGLVHHWVGASFIPNVTIDDVLDLSRTYAEYSAIYESVLASRLLGQDGDTFRVFLRLQEDAGIIEAQLDVWSDIRYVRASATRAYSVANATEIREVVDVGQPSERLLPAGRDRGFLWRASTYAKYVERDGGVYTELETLGLSRSFPPVLGWIIEPIARRIGRKSVEGSLGEFRSAILHGTPGRSR